MNGFYHEVIELGREPYLGGSLIRICVNRSIFYGTDLSQGRINDFIGQPLPAFVAHFRTIDYSKLQCLRWLGRANQC